jgi:NADPH-dependent ferric siderophore reductase
MRRIHFTGDDLAGFEWRGPAGHLKLIVPDDGQHSVPMPTPDGPRSPFMRTYTPRRFDTATRTLEIDFVVHSHGPAGRWAARAAAGDQLVMIGPAPGYVVDSQAQWFLLVGDETALPAIESILEEIPSAARTRVLLEVAAPDELRRLPADGTAHVNWLIRKDEPSAGAALEAAVSALGSLPEGSGRVYVACEAGAMRRIRAILKQQYGLAGSQMVTRGYWRLGEMNHPDHDFGD